MRLTALLGSVVAIAAAVAVVATGRAPTAKAEAETALPALIAAPEPNLAQENPATVAGEVLETLSASRYTYLRLRTPAGEVWAAVPAAAIALHSRVEIANAARMDDFKSTTLKRTFKVVYFGTLSGSAGTLPAVSDDQPLPPGHPDIGTRTAGPVNDGDELPPGHPDVDGAGPFAK